MEELQMPHFELDLDQDGAALSIYKDGELIDGAISLESPNSIVQTYFVSAVRNIDAMTVGDNPDGDRARDHRHFGLQAFLMSLVGTEAFLNIYFHQLGNLQGLDDVIDLARSDKPIEHKLGHRSEEHTSELQSLMRTSYAVFCLKKKKTKYKTTLLYKHIQ